MRQASRDQSRLPGEAAATLTFSSRASSLPRPGPTTRACSRGSHCSISWTASGLSLNKRRVGGLFLCSFPLLIQLQTLADFPQGPFPVPGPEPGLLQDPPLGSPLGCKMPSWPPPRPRPPKASSLKQSARGEGGFPGGVGRPDGIQRASLVAQLVKNLPAMLKISVRFLGGEAPLEQSMANVSNG